jgi:putative transposase
MGREEATMKFEPETAHRKSIRLKGYDYSQAGGYYVTIVAFGRECLFGELADGEMVANPLGKIVREEWFRSANVRKEIRLFEDDFVLMPNHVHGLVWIDANAVGADGVRPDEDAGVKNKGTRRVPLQRKPKSLGSFIAGFKASVTRRAMHELDSGNIWQRNFYEHIIRDQTDYERISGYIIDNPANWYQDDENPQHAALKGDA